MKERELRELVAKFKANPRLWFASGWLREIELQIALQQLCQLVDSDNSKACASYHDLLEDV